jgi:hypothetical protein
MEFRLSPRPRPHDWRRHRRLEWLMIYLPLILGLFGLVGLGVLLGRAQVASASTWADAGLVLLLVVALGPALILLMLVLGIAVGLWYLARWLPLPMERGREWFAQSAGMARRVGDLAARPVVAPSAAWAALAAAWGSLASIFRTPGGGDE